MKIAFNVYFDDADGHACGVTLFALLHVSDVTPRKSKSHSADCSAGNNSLVILASARRNALEGTL